MPAISLVSDLLRSPDVAKVVLEATLVTASETSQDLQNRRVLAVISHKDDWDLTEEGSLFVCKYKNHVNGQLDELDIQRVFPIYGEFSVVISQMRRGTVDLRPTMSSKSVLEQPRAVITLSITPSEGLSNDVQPPTFFTYDVQGLKSLVAECKRMKEVSDVEANAVINLAQSTTHFSWLKPYFAKHTTITTLASTSQDLREINRPSLERLSPACAGQTGDDHADAQAIRDEWVRVKARDLSRNGRRRLTMRLGTFNVNGKMPSQDLSAWVQASVNATSRSQPNTVTPALPPLKKISPLSLGNAVQNPFNWLSGRSKSTPKANITQPEDPILRVDPTDPDDPDLLVFGFQELDLSTEALIYSTGTAREDAWCLAIFAALGEKAVKYEKLVSRQLMGMLIVIIVKKCLKDCFGNIRTSVAGAGILGVMGNKGGTAIRLSFTPPAHNSGGSSKSPWGPTSLTFVNAHLAAFDEMVDKRNSDFQDLSKRLLFEGIPARSSSPAPESESVDDSMTSDVPPTPSLGLTPSLSVYETDALFWLGDLNYRVDVSDADMRKILRDDDWDNAQKLEALLRFDQLKKAMRSKKAFFGFQESPITHFPTYRFSPGLMMDKFGYDYKRKPAWTDRILYMNSPGCRVNQLAYTGHPQIMMSDHRPVSADFSVDVDLFDPNALYTNVRNLFNDVERLDGESTHEKGGLRVVDTYVDFEKVLYGVPVERKVTVKNLSKGPCAFRFVPVQLDSPIHPEWLQIHPKTGILLPDEVVEISMVAYVDNAIASILNLRPKDLSGTLILHTILGKDHFISVSGEYQYTCFANKLSHLNRLRGPVREMESPNDLLPEIRSTNAPAELMRLLDWIMTNKIIPDDLFLAPGNDTVIQRIQECLDTGDDFPYNARTPASDEQIPRSFAVTLVRFLDSLLDSIMPAHLHLRCLEMTNRDEAFELLNELPPSAINVWITVTSFLHFICKSSKKENQAERVATVFAPIFMRDDPHSLIPPISPKAKSKFLLYFMG
ncbi:hypothetical protein M413DRAFT_146739 [Hebeloma cylindrosporum]|uniref:Rho-GAP domain-containing protein n=1 Tax=Hebeloma cylindrosporum TaxID=76867 RepID=A0A0C2YJX7_HEBCY|nr:hypothetical protein M413DRAFT_146739 [Hebeloma cylindrosporum h7]